MATRATIKVEGFNLAKLYKHFDGYPEATLEWLKSFNEDFTKNRGVDATYKFAQLIRSSYKDADNFDLDKSSYTGWGVVGLDEDMGAEFEYRLLNDGTVTVKSL
jgi:hypothetical protein